LECIVLEALLEECCGQRVSNTKGHSMGLCMYLRSTLESLYSEQRFGFCDGLRGIAVLWVCSLHAGVFTNLIPTDPSWWFLWPIFNGTAGVDVFLVLSGFLIGGALCRELMGTGRLAIVKFAVRRFWRIYPVLACAVLLHAILLPSMGACPYKVWWMNLYLLNNFPAQDLFRGCVDQAWSVSLELQLYFATPPLFALASLLSSRVLKGGITSPRCAAALAALLWLSSTLWRLAAVFSQDLVGQSISPSGGGVTFYMHTQYRCGAYLAGLIAGIAAVTHRQDDPACTESGCRVSTAALAVSLLIWGLTLFYGVDADSTYKGDFPTVAALHLALWRPIFGVAVAGIVFLCASGQAPRLARWLGSAAWRPVARLSYSMYLLQFVGLATVDRPFEGLMRITSDADSRAWLRTIAFFTVVMVFILGSMVLAILSYLLVERPGMLLGKLCIDLLPGARASGAASKGEEGGSARYEIGDRGSQAELGQDLEAAPNIESSQASRETTDIGSSDGQETSESHMASFAEVGEPSPQV